MTIIGECVVAAGAYFVSNYADIVVPVLAEASNKVIKIGVGFASYYVLDSICEKVSRNFIENCKGMLDSPSCAANGATEYLSCFGKVVAAGTVVVDTIVPGGVQKVAEVVKNKIN